MIETLLGIFTSSGFGAITGIAGAWLTRREERKVLELNNQHEVRMAEVRAREMEFEATHELQMVDKEIDRAQAEGAIAADVEAARAFTESQRSLQQSTGHPWSDLMRGVMRPLITVYLLVALSILTFKISELVGGLDAMPPEEAAELFRYVVYQVVYLAVTAVMWWFGSRPGRSTTGKAGQ